jgi:hypothetical protein
MSKYNVFVAAYPNDSLIEETLTKLLSIYEGNSKEGIYCSVIENVEMISIPADLGYYITNGFKEEK